MEECRVDVIYSHSKRNMTPSMAERLAVEKEQQSMLKMYDGIVWCRA